MVDSTRFLKFLTALYGDSIAAQTLSKLISLMDSWRGNIPAPSSADAGLSERDAMLITYGDQVRERGMPPLRTLAAFLDRHLEGSINCLHILPFYPYSSDDGFSVIDFRQVSSGLGSWADIAKLDEKFRLMFDAVVNHASARSVWFSAFLRGEKPYSEYFIEMQESAELSKVVRPRALPLLHRLGEPPNAKSIWTTFSADQVDLNYRSPRLLLEVIDLLLYYVSKGAEFIRLDAIAYIWKEVGTSCIHLPQTHLIIQLFRAVLDEVAPHVKLITETNVPHADNISYFGDGHNEAQLVYNFALPPLVLHTFHTGNASHLSQWASDITPPSDEVTFFNFLASHDGIGVNPVRGILPDSAIEAIIQRVLAHGGLVSYKHNPDGSSSPYEMNINYFDALSDPDGAESFDLQVDRFMAAQSIMLTLAGMPGIYFHSFFGSRGWKQGPAQTGHNRSINREKFTLEQIESELKQENTLRHKVVKRYEELLHARLASSAFHPFGRQKVLKTSEAIFALLRQSPSTLEKVLCLVNVTDRPQPVDLDPREIFESDADVIHLTDLISGRLIEAQRTVPLNLSPYEICWLAAIEK
ncbi:MAG: sugar phosphorylase [Chloroflexota bacterium]